MSDEAICGCEISQLPTAKSGETIELVRTTGPGDVVIYNLRPSYAAGATWARIRLSERCCIAIDLNSQPADFIRESGTLKPLGALSIRLESEHQDVGAKVTCFLERTDPDVDQDDSGEPMLASKLGGTAFGLAGQLPREIDEALAQGFRLVALLSEYEFPFFKGGIGIMARPPFATPDDWRWFYDM